LFELPTAHFVHFITLLLRILKEAGFSDRNHFFQDDQLIFSVREFFVAGTEIVSGVLSWLIIILLRNPQYYQKMQEEIDQHVGKLTVLNI